MPMLFPNFGGNLGTGGGGGATDPHWDNVVLLLGADGSDGSTSFTDESPVGRTLTANGNAQIDTAQSKFGGGAALFDGAGDSIEAADHADWTFGGEFTVECWARFAAVAKQQIFASHYNAITGQRSWFFALSGPSNDELQFAYSLNGSTGVFDFRGTWSPVVDTWYFVAVDRDASDVARLYIDGTMVASKTITGSLHNINEKLFIGRTADSTNDYMDGWIDELRITKGVGRYASDSGHTVPSAAFPRQ